MNMTACEPVVLSRHKVHYENYQDLCKAQTGLPISTYLHPFLGTSDPPNPHEIFNSPNPPQWSRLNQATPAREEKDFVCFCVRQRCKAFQKHCDSTSIYQQDYFMSHVLTSWIRLCDFCLIFGHSRRAFAPQQELAYHPPCRKYSFQ